MRRKETVLLWNGQTFNPSHMSLESRSDGPARATITLRDQSVPDPGLGEPVVIAYRLDTYPRGGWRKLVARLLRRPLFQDYPLASMVVERIETRFDGTIRIDLVDRFYADAMLAEIRPPGP